APCDQRRCGKQALPSAHGLMLGQDVPMDIEAALDFVSTQHHAVLATLKGDGTPQLSPVTLGVAAAGTVVITTRQAAYKVRNIRRDPRVWLCGFPDTFFGRWVQIEGT